MRLFIALPVAPGARRALTETQRSLQKSGVRGRFPPPENLHLTLVFLGGVKDPAPVIAAMRCAPVPKTALAFDRLTLFGDTLAALLKKDPALEAYVLALRAALDEAGVKYDQQAFRPHITLCRKAAQPGAAFRLYPFEKPLRALRLPVTEVRLTESDLSGETPVYRAVYRVRGGGF